MPSLPPVNWLAVASIVFGASVGVFQVVRTHPGEFFEWIPIGVIVAIALVVIAGFEWPIYTSNSPRARWFFRIGPIAMLILAPVVMYVVASAHQEQFRPEEYVVPQNPTEQEAAILTELQQIISDDDPAVE